MVVVAIVAPALPPVLPRPLFFSSPCRCAYSDLPLRFSTGDACTVSIERRVHGSRPHTKDNCLLVVRPLNTPTANSKQLFIGVSEAGTERGGGGAG